MKKNKKIISVSSTSLLLLGLVSCAVPKNYVEVPTDQMPSKHRHIPMHEKDITYDTSGNQDKTISSIQDKLRLVYFDFDSTKLLPGEKEKIIEMAQALKNISTDATIVIAGHTDQVGSKSYNKMLGLERAKSVRDVLLNEGVDPAMLKIKSFGESKPRVETNDLAEMEANRRVGFII